MEPKWESITNALDPFNTKPSLDPGTQYMVPRPETSALDEVIGHIEEQLGELQVPQHTHTHTHTPFLSFSLSLFHTHTHTHTLLSSPQDAFSDQWFLLERLTAREREAGLAKDVMDGIDSQVRDMLVSHCPIPLTAQYFHYYNISHRLMPTSFQSTIRQELFRG